MGASQAPAAAEESEEQAVARAAAKKVKKQQAQQPEEQSQQQQQQQLSQKQQQQQRHQRQEVEEWQAEGKTAEGPSHSTAAYLDLQARRQHEAEAIALAPQWPAQATAEEEAQSTKSALSQPEVAPQAASGLAASMPHPDMKTPTFSLQPASSMLTSACCKKLESATNCVPGQISRPAPKGGGR